LGTKAAIRQVNLDETGQVDDRLSQEGSDELRLDITDATNMFNEPEDGEAEGSPEIGKFVFTVRLLIAESGIL